MVRGIKKVNNFIPAYIHTDVRAILEDVTFHFSLLNTKSLLPMGIEPESPDQQSAMVSLHKMPLIKVAWYVLRVKIMHSWSP